MLHLATAVFAERLAHKHVVDVQQVQRLAVAERRSHQRGVLEIGEHDGAETGVNQLFCCLVRRCVHGRRVLDPTEECLDDGGIDFENLVRHEAV